MRNQLPHTYWLNTTNVYYLTVSVGEKFESNLAVWFWLRIAREVLVKLLAGLLPSSEVWTGAGGTTSETAHFMAVDVLSVPHWLLAGGMGPPPSPAPTWLSLWASSLHELTSLVGLSERSGEERASRWRNAVLWSRCWGVHCRFCFTYLLEASVQI